MISVTILAFDNALASAVTGMNDLLSLAGVAWNILHQQEPTPKFKVRIASWDKAPIKTLNKLVILPHCAIQDIEQSDVYLVPNISGDIEKTLQRNLGLTALLRRLSQTGSLIASNSSGSFFLAEAGLLDGKIATTHWGLVEEFARKYPEVLLKPEQSITHTGNILCEGGGMTWFDLGLYLIELYCDHETALRTSKAFVIDSSRTAQLSYSPLIGKKYHKDKAILAIQNWMEAHYASEILIHIVAQEFGLSNRSLIRRFKEATGSAPASYLQDVRIYMASMMLVQSNKTISEITVDVGYEDASTFTKLFKRKLGLPPSSYRDRYKPGRR